MGSERKKKKKFSYYFINRNLFSIFFMLFITEIRVKTMLFDMLITRYSTYSPQLMRTVIHLVAFSFRFVTLLIISCCYVEPNKFNTNNENKHDAKRYVITRQSILCVFLFLTRVGDKGKCHGSWCESWMESKKFEDLGKFFALKWLRTEIKFMNF